MKFHAGRFQLTEMDIKKFRFSPLESWIHHSQPSTRMVPEILRHRLSACLLSTVTRCMCPKSW